jgi:DNA gyrase/topoisomerase IV subunit A
VIGPNGKLREYNDEHDLIRDFCDYRMSILQKRIDLRKEEATELARWLNIKMQFIKAVLDDKIKFKNRKKDEVVVQILAETEAQGDDADRLLRINIMSLTDEMVKQLQKEIKEAKDELKYWKTTTSTEQFSNDLQELSTGDH